MSFAFVTDPDPEIFKRQSKIYSKFHKLLWNFFLKVQNVFS